MQVITTVPPMQVTTTVFLPTKVISTVYLLMQDIRTVFLPMQVITTVSPTSAGQNNGSPTYAGHHNGLSLEATPYSILRHLGKDIFLSSHLKRKKKQKKKYFCYLAKSGKKHTTKLQQLTLVCPINHPEGPKTPPAC